MEQYEDNEGHPYGVLPIGNMYFASQSEIMTRYYGLGPNMCKLTDELVAEVLGFLAGTDLMTVLQVSRTLYCHANSSDLWRDATLRDFDGKGIKYENSWKDAYLHTRAHHSSVPVKVINHRPIAMRGVFSSFLHRTWSCHTCDLNSACPGFYDQSDIPVREAATLSLEEFVESYEIPNKPVVIRGAMYTDHATDAEKQVETASYCPALTKWTNEHIIEQCGATSRLRATSAAAPLPALFTAEEYFAYATQAREEAPLYLFERNFAKMAPGLLQDYEVSKYFRASSSAGTLPNTGDTPTGTSAPGNGTNRVALNKDRLKDPSLVYETDLFRVLGETGRPDYRWLVAGPARSGSLFHIDPNQTNAWNLCVRGRKKWIFYPPGVSPPGVECSMDGADVVVPISTGEWLLTFWKYHLEARQDPDPARRPLEVILHPGEVIFVPHGYWHMVVNLDDSIALTHNYVSTSNLTDVLRFLREKTDQISGVRDRGGEAIAPEEMYASFVAKLSTVLPPEVVDRHVQESCKPERGLSELEKAKLVLQRSAQALKRKRNWASGFTSQGSQYGSGADEAAVKRAVPGDQIAQATSTSGGESGAAGAVGAGGGGGEGGNGTCSAVFEAAKASTSSGEAKSAFSFGFAF